MILFHKSTCFQVCIIHVLQQWLFAWKKGRIFTVMKAIFFEVVNKHLSLSTQSKLPSLPFARI